MTDISIWGYSIPKAWITQREADYLKGLPQALPTVEWVWAEMDRIWHEIGLDNSRPLTGQPIGEFYRHPVWLMNGIFTALDPVSNGHREAIARYLAKTGAKVVADYGGGFGELARAVTGVAPGMEVSIIEPYPSRVGLERVQNEARIQFVSDLSGGHYDAIVAQDVLEHVEDPIGLASEIAGAVREGGIVLFANCFYPCIECHLPATFHLRHTFPTVMKALGLSYLGTVVGATHAQAFERAGRRDLARARHAERISRILGPLLNTARETMSRTKRLVVR